MSEVAIIAISGAIQALSTWAVTAIQAKSPELRAAESAFWVQVLKGLMKLFGHGDVLP